MMQMEIKLFGSLASHASESSSRILNDCSIHRCITDLEMDCLKSLDLILYIFLIIMKKRPWLFLAEASFLFDLELDLHFLRR